jgi:ketosteroid isomerase-like protein
MSQENVNAIRNLYDLFAKGDVPTVLAGFDPNIEWNEAENFPYADGNPYVGPNAVLEGVFMRLGSEWDYWNLDIGEVLDAGESVVAMGRYQAKNKVTGKEINAQFAHVWKVRDGKAVSFQQYADTHQVVNAVTSS